MKVAIASYGFAEYCIQQANGLVRSCEVLLLLPRSEAEEYRRAAQSGSQNCAVCQPATPPADAPVAFRRRPGSPDPTFSSPRAPCPTRTPVVQFVLPWLRSYPLVTTIHDPRHHVGDRTSQKTPQVVMDFGFRRANQVIVHGQVLKRQVHELLGISADRIHVIPHVALGPEVAPAAGSDSAPQILFFGRIWKYKGLEYLIRAQPMITAAFPEARIVIAGAGEDFAPYRRQMADPDRFIIRNHFIEPAERDELFRQASIVVLPYIEATQSGVVPLAYACAKPVIATAHRRAERSGRRRPHWVAGAPRRLGRIGPGGDRVARRPGATPGDGDGRGGRSSTPSAPAIVARQTIEVYQRAIDDRQRHRRPPRIAAMRAATVTQTGSERAALPTQHH